MATSANSKPPGKTILIVDDELSIVEVLEFILKDAGFLVKTAFNGRDALASLKDNLPDLVILDYMMPILDGDGVIRAMHANAEYANVPIILTSALPEATIRARFNGYQAFLQKPYRVEPLMREISRLLNPSSEA
jgi:CheY-like chemotaxis protein